MSHLALPKGRVTASPQPPSAVASAAPSPARPSSTSKGVLDREALDEADDVDDEDLLDVHHARRRGDDAEGDGDGDGEKDDDDDDGGEGGDGGMSMGMTLGGGMGGGRVGQKKNTKGGLIESKGTKRREDTYLLRGQLDEEQGKRFDTFNMTAINKNAIRRVTREVHDQVCPPQLALVVAGMAKVFISDVIELAKDLQPHTAHPTGPLRPYHLKLARMHLEKSGLVGDGIHGPSSGLRPRKSIFRRK
ncbi:hypothetical protein IAT38_007470 [Cryptococcus sp. DSM 104549]